MSKYARTENWIYECGICCPRPPHYCVPGFFDDTKLITKEGLGREYPAEEHIIIKQADTIEELCDMFFLEDNADFVEVPKHTTSLAGIKNHTRIRKEILDHNISHVRELLGKKPGFKYEYNVYGGICVKGKGLIYVAKMNEKGEFELL